MAIVSSVIREDAPQRDGRRRITEAHTDHLGVVYTRTYLADTEFDAVAPLSARAADLVGQLEEEEFRKNLEAIFTRRYTAITTQHLTVTQVRSRLRQAFQSVTREEACLIAAYLLTLTNGQLQTLFGIAAGQVAALRTRLQVRVDALTALEAIIGE